MARLLKASVLSAAYWRSQLYCWLAALQELTDWKGRLQRLDPAISQYRDRRFRGNQEEFDLSLRTSVTLYIGNLSFYTTEEQIYEARHFSHAGWVPASAALL